MRFGLLPAEISRAAAVSGPTPKMLTRAGAAIRVRSFQLGLQIVDLLVELKVAACKGPKGVFGRRGGILENDPDGSSCTAPRGQWPSDRRVILVVLAGAVTTRAFIWLTAWVRALTAEPLVLLSIRIISISPSPDLGVALATPASTARAAISASVGSLLPFRYRVDRSSRLTSTTVKPRTGQESGKSGTVGTSAIDPKGANLTQLSGPPFELPIPVTGRWDVALCETHTLMVNGKGHVLVLVSIDTDDHLNSVHDFAIGDCCHFCLLKK